MSYGFKIIVTGDYACFSRPEMKVERVSYDVPTPSALEGLIKSVYWKPAVRYQINKIVVFNPLHLRQTNKNHRIYGGFLLYTRFLHDCVQYLHCTFFLSWVEVRVGVPCH